MPIPEGLALVLRRARRHGAEYVLFDCDAPPMQDLPVIHPDFPEHQSALAE